MSHALTSTGAAMHLHPKIEAIHVSVICASLRELRSELFAFLQGSSDWDLQAKVSACTGLPTIAVEFTFYLALIGATIL